MILEVKQDTIRHVDRGFKIEKSCYRRGNKGPIIWHGGREGLEAVDEFKIETGGDCGKGCWEKKRLKKDLEAGEGEKALRMDHGSVSGGRPAAAPRWGVGEGGGDEEGDCRDIYRDF